MINVTQQSERADRSDLCECVFVEGFDRSNWKTGLKRLCQTRIQPVPYLTITERENWKVSSRIHDIDINSTNSSHESQISTFDSHCQAIGKV